MVRKILIFISILSLASAVSAAPNPCDGLLGWINNQPPAGKTWANYQAQNKELALDSSTQEKYEAAIDYFSKNIMDPESAMADCRKIMAVKGGRKGLAGLFNQMIGIRESNEARPAQPNADSQIEEKEVNETMGMRDRLKKMKEDDKKDLEGIVKSCDKSPFYDKSCLIDFNALGIPESFQGLVKVEDLKSQPLPDLFSPDDCDCLKKKLEDKGQNTKSIMDASQKEEESVKQEVVKAAGKKFINDFASYMEDIQYFATNQAWVLSPDKKFDPSLLCQDFSAFKKTVDAQCAANGTDAGKDARVAAVMGAFGDAFNPSGKDFEKGFKSLVDDIYTYTEDANKVEEGKPNVLTRKQYELGRFVFNKDQKHVSVVDSIITIILRDKRLKERVLKNVESHSPYDEITEIMAGSNTELTKDILKQVRKEFGEFKVSSKIDELIKDIGKPEYKEKFSSVFDLGLMVNPGLKNLMTDSNLFKESVATWGKSKRNTKYMAAVEHDTHLLSGHFRDRCQALQKNLAEIVCTKNDDLLKHTKPQDVAQLLYSQKMLQGPKLPAHSLMICQMNNNTEISESFKGMDLKSLNQFAISDYLDLKLTKDNRMAKMLRKANSDEKFASQISDLSRQYSSYRVSAPSTFDDYTSKNSNAMSFSKEVASLKDLNPTFKEAAANGSRSSTRSTTFDAVTSAVDQTVNLPTNNEISKSMSQIMPSYGQNLPSVAPTKEMPVSGQQQMTSVPQQQLKEVFANASEKQKTQKLVDNISSKDAEELLALKKENDRVRDEITQLKLENERKKTQELKEKYDELEKRYTQAAQTYGTVGGPKDVVGKTGFSSGGFSQDVNQVLDQKGTQSGQGASTFAGPGNFHDIAATANAVSGTFKDVDVKSEPNLIITSNHKDASGKVVEDPSSDLISYLKSNEADGLTLKKIKEAGIIYTYETQEKDGQKVVKQKLIKYSDLSPAAKTLVDSKLASIAINNLKRAYSIQALKLELMTMAYKNQKN